MNSLRSFAASVSCFVALGVSAVQAAPLTDVVFGNLGASGTNGLSSTSTDFGPGGATTIALAQGFTTGSSSTNLSLQSVSIGAFATSVGTLPRTVSIYSSVSDNPGVALFTSSATNVGNNGLYTFNFSGATLSASTNYWVVPDSSNNWTWFFNAAEEQPTEQNSSGYAYLGTLRQASSNPGTWVNSGSPYSVSVQAVPEPSTYAMAAIGAGVAGLCGWRRRKAAIAV